MAKYFANTEEVAQSIAKLEKLHGEFTTAASSFTSAGYANIDTQTWSGKAVEAFKTCLESVTTEVQTVLDRVQKTRNEIDGILSYVKSGDEEFRTAYSTAEADLLQTSSEVDSLMPEML